ncbi:MAG: MJ0042-type zinc finger domain-containing protein [Alphaproteobacteria bacterium]
MNLTCPSCDVRFFVEPGQLGPTGRRVRCGECRHTWHQQPVAEDQTPPSAPAPEPEPAADPATELAAAKAVAESFAPSEADAGAGEEPKPAEPTQPAEPESVAEPKPSVEAAPEVAPGAAPRVEEAGLSERVSRRAFAKPARPQSKPPRLSLATGWTIYAVVVIGLASGFYYGRAPLVAMVPEMTRLYDLIGLREETIELGLELRDVKSVRRLIDGNRVVVIEGRIVNLSDRDRRVPPLRASVTDAEGTELDRWTFQAASASLPPGGTTRFETVAKNPPREGNLSIDFVAEN